MDRLSRENLGHVTFTMEALSPELALVDPELTRAEKLHIGSQILLLINELCAEKTDMAHFVMIEGTEYCVALYVKM